jgi:hypothetical protein
MLIGWKGCGKGMKCGGATDRLYHRLPDSKLFEKKNLKTLRLANTSIK